MALLVAGPRAARAAGRVTRSTATLFRSCGFPRPDMQLCKDCGRMIPASENKFKFEDADALGPVYVCQTCGTRRLKAAEPKKAKA